MKNLTLIIALFALVLYSCQAPESEPDLDQLRAELQQMEDSYADGSNSKDAVAVLNYYAEDANSLAANEPTRVGKTAIRDGIEKDFMSDDSGSTSRFEVVDVYADGNLVVEVGRSISTDTDGNKTAGKYISVFENRGGKLVCVRDIWNVDAPEGQLKKGNLVGVHTFTVNLKPGVTMDQYMEFFENNYITEANKLYGSKSYLTEGIRGENENSFGMMVVFKTEADRNKFYNEDGSNTVLGQSIVEKLGPLMEEAVQKFGSFSTKYTDWIVQ